MILFESRSMMMDLITMLLIRMWWCCWSKGQNAEDVFADRKIKVLKILLIKMLKILVMIKRSKCWRCCCWSKGQSVEDVADRKVKVLKMWLKMLMIERSKCWRCFWSKGQNMLMLIKELLSLKIEDEDYMMLKSFQWFIDVLPWWCWWCPLSLPYYCCCWCCCRIPFSLRGSVEIL